MGKRDQDVGVSIPEEKHSRKREEKMGMKKRKSNKRSSYSACNYSGEAASWSISKTNISLVKKLRPIHSLLTPNLIITPPVLTTRPIRSSNPAPLTPGSTNYKKAIKNPHMTSTTMNSGGSDDEDESKEIYSGHRVSEKGTSLSTMSYVQCLALALLLGLLVASFYVDKLKQYEICGVLLWKWSLM